VKLLDEGFSYKINTPNGLFTVVTLLEEDETYVRFIDLRGGEVTFRKELITKIRKIDKIKVGEQNE
jgi:uncharacterized iron-regulated protein